MNESGPKIGRRSRGAQPATGHREHGGRIWRMLVCCIPMFVIAGGLVVVGAVPPGFLLIAAACTALMAVMHGGRHGSHEAKADAAATPVRLPEGSSRSRTVAPITEQGELQNALREGNQHAAH